MREPLENLSLAQEACAYARTKIPEGSTPLVNNLYASAALRISLKKAINQMREYVPILAEQAERNWKKNTQKSDFYEQDRVLVRMKTVVKHFKHNKLGNCGELALVAFYYVLKKQPQTQAEVCLLEKGEHAFLVLGRKIESDPLRPETWGEDAYICDPWANTIYPASQYKEKTKCYKVYAVGEDSVNQIDDFIPGYHSFTFDNRESSHYLGARFAEKPECLAYVGTPVVIDQTRILHEVEEMLEQTRLMEEAIEQQTRKIDEAKVSQNSYQLFSSPSLKQEIVDNTAPLQKDTMVYT